MGIRDRLLARMKKLVGGAPAGPPRAAQAPARPATPPATPAPPAPAAAKPASSARPAPEPASAPTAPPATPPAPAAAPEPASAPTAPPATPAAPAAAPALEPEPAPTSPDSTAHTAPAPAAPPTPPAATAPPPAATSSPAPASTPAAVSLNALLEDDHATSDAPVRNAHYADTYQTTEAALQVRVYSAAEGLDITFPCEPGEYVLDAAERAGHELPFSCRGGGCIVCAGRVDEGEVEMDEQYVLDEDHIADRFRLLCCTTVQSDAVFESHLEDAVD